MSQQKSDSTVTVREKTGSFSIEIRHPIYEDHPIKEMKRRLAAREHLFKQIQDIVFDGQEYHISANIEPLPTLPEDAPMSKREKMTLYLFYLFPDSCKIGDYFVDLCGEYKKPKYKVAFPAQYIRIPHTDLSFNPVTIPNKKMSVWERIN